jgi:hypothetical protein
MGDITNRNSNNSKGKYELDQCSNLTKKIENYRKQIEKKLEKVINHILQFFKSKNPFN